MLAFTLAAAISAPTALGDVGYEGLPTSGTGTPTGTKRSESVLWFNDGAWWGNMWDAATGDFHIFRLDQSTHKWIDSGVPVDTRANTHADVLWDGTHLYVASHAFVADGDAAVSGTPSYLYRFSYNAASRSYSLDAGYPAVINNMKTETLVIDKDSTGKLWATWQQANRIYLNRTTGGDSMWGVPFVLPGSGTVTVDDNSAVVAFGGDKIGVMWSDQTTASDGMYFAVHQDVDPEATWQASRTAIQGPGTADDHMNLKSVQADASGRVLAAVKTSFTSSASPLIMLLVRDAVTGDWTSYPVARVSDCPNRPLVLIDEENRLLHVFATYPGPPGYSCNSSGGEIREKTSSLDAISFPSGGGTTVIQDANSPSMHNVSSTKQGVNSRSGIVLLAYNSGTQRYWHAEESIGPPQPQAPNASFTANPGSGVAPLPVQFTDTSTGVPTTWSWTFGDGSGATVENPAHTYSLPGTYAVTLAVANAYGSSTATQQVSVTQPVPDFSLTASPSSITVVRGASASYTITATPINDFAGDVSLSVTGVPAGASATVSPNPISLARGPSTATLRVATDGTVKPGTYTLKTTGSAGLLAHSTSVSLQVKRR